MLSKRFFPLLVSIFVMLMMLGGTGTVGANPIKLTYANFFPPFHVQSQLAESWCKEVEKRTDGAVKIDYYPGGTLSKAPQIYDNVEMGVADIGMTVLAYSRGRFPILGAVDLPLGYPSGVVATRVANAVLEKFNPKEVHDTHVMYLHAHGPGYIHTVEKPVHQMADMKGLKIRSTGMSTFLVKALGATPVAQSMGDTYQSLQKGVVDGSAHPLESNKGWKLGEVVKYVVTEDSVSYTTNMIVTMNKSKWNSLPPEVQKIITEINEEWAVKHGEAWDQIDVAGKEFLKEKGKEIITLSSEESQKWQAAVAPALEEYAKKLDKKKLNGTELIAFIKESIEKMK